MQSRHILIGLIILFIAIKLLWLYTHPLLYLDEYTHLISARYIMENHSFFTGHGFQIPFYGVIYMPLFHIILAILLSLFNLTVTRLIISISIPLITTYFLYKLFFRYDKTGIVAMLSNFIPAYFIWSSMLYTDAMVVMFSAATLYYFLQRRTGHWVFLYIFGSLVKNFNFIFALLIPFYFISRKRKDDSFKIALFISIPLFLFQVYMIVINHEYIINTLKLVGTINYGLTNYNFVLFVGFFVFTMFWIPLTVFKTLWKEHRTILIWMLIFIVPLMLGDIESRRALLATPIVFLSLWIGIKDKQLRAVMVTILFIGCLIEIFQTNDFYQPNVCMMSSIYWLKDNVPKDSLILTPFPTETYYYSNISAMTFNKDLKTNNATHIYIQKDWIKNGFYYGDIKNASTLKENGWKSVWDGGECEILERMVG